MPPGYADALLVRSVLEEGKCSAKCADDGTGVGNRLDRRYDCRACRC